jgi:hypothetical protein
VATEPVVTAASLDATAEIATIMETPVSQASDAMTAPETEAAPSADEPSNDSSESCGDSTTAETNKAEQA